MSWNKPGKKKKPGRLSRFLFLPGLGDFVGPVIAVVVVPIACCIVEAKGKQVVLHVKGFFPAFRGMLHAIILNVSPAHGVAKTSMKKYLSGAGVVQQAIVIDRDVAPVRCKGFYMGSALMIRPTVVIQILHLLICFFDKRCYC